MNVSFVFVERTRMGWKVSLQFQRKREEEVQIKYARCFWKMEQSRPCFSMRLGNQSIEIVKRERAMMR